MQLNPEKYLLMFVDVVDVWFYAKYVSTLIDDSVVPVFCDHHLLDLITSEINL